MALTGSGALVGAQAHCRGDDTQLPQAARWTWWRPVHPDILLMGQAWEWLQRWLPHFYFFFLQLGVPFSSRDVVSVANRSLSRLGEIKTALVYVLHPDSAEDAENPSCTGAEGLMPGASCKALVPLNCPWAFPHCTFSQADTDKPLDGNSSLLLLHRKHIQGFVNCCCSVLPK